MKTYSEFCQRYQLNPAAPDTQIQFEQYQQAYETLMVITGKAALSDMKSV